MSTDRELLELAAKAAGIGGSWGDKLDYHNGLVDLTDFWVLDGEELYFWSPLTDDGDALRLAVKCQIAFGAYDSYVSAGSIGRELEEVVVWFHKVKDHSQATRLAIVRAAAEIGRSMP